MPYATSERRRPRRSLRSWRAHSSIALWPALLPIALAEILHAFASSVLGPAIAALSLALVGHGALGERLGRNARYLAIGNAFAAGLMGTFGYFVGERAVFLLTAALGIPALAAIEMIRNADLARLKSNRTGVDVKARKCRLVMAVSQRPQAARLCCMRKPVPTWQCGDAADCRRDGDKAGRQRSVIGDCSLHRRATGGYGRDFPLGRAIAEGWGRRPILLLGFAVLPIRGMLFAGIADPYLMILIQLLDGLSAAALGVLTPLIVADITRDTGRLHDRSRSGRARNRRRRNLEHHRSRPHHRCFRGRGGLPRPRRSRVLRNRPCLDRNAGNETGR